MESPGKDAEVDREMHVTNHSAAAYHRSTARTDHFPTRPQCRGGESLGLSDCVCGKMLQSDGEIRMNPDWLMLEGFASH